MIQDKIRKHAASLLYPQVDKKMYVHTEVIEDVEPVRDEKDQIMRLIFAPDPLTGNPRCDLGYVLTGADEGFSQFIKENLMVKQPEIVGSEVESESFDLSKRHLEDLSEYRQRIEEYLNTKRKEE